MLKEDTSARRLLITCLILAVVLLAYYNALSNGFVYDDVDIIKINPLIRGWHNIPAIFTTGYWQPSGSSGGLYRPLTIFSFLLDYSIAGIDPYVFHLSNVFLHFLCCLFVYLLAKRLTRNEPASVIAALLFAAHPVHVEAVANTVGRSELLATLFTLAGLYSFINFPRRTPWLVVSPFLMLAGLLSKETAVVLPLLALTYLLLFERDARGRDIKNIALSLAPFALVTCLYLAARFTFLSGEAYPQDTGQVLLSIGLYSRILVMLKVFLYYIKLALFPTELYAFYMLKPPASLFSPSVLLFIGFTGTLAAYAPWLIRNRRVHFYFLLWFIIALLPVSNIVPIGVLMSERAMYLPSVSVCVLGGLLFSWAGGGLARYSGYKTIGVAAASVLVLGSFLIITHDRNKVWHDAISLDNELVRSYRRAITEFPDSGLYYSELASPLEELGNEDEAIDNIKTAIKLEPDTAKYHVELARIYAKDFRYSLAIPEVLKATAHMIEPTAEEDALFAEVFYKTDNKAEFRRFISYLLSSNPEKDPQKIMLIASHLYEMGMLDRSEEYIKKALELDPYVWELHLNYAYILKQRGATDDAIKELGKALELNPDASEAYYERGLLFGTIGKYPKAVSDLEIAVSLKPAAPNYHYMLAVAYIGIKRYDDAERELNDALRLKPDYPEARELLKRRR